MHNRNRITAAAIISALAAAPALAGDSSHFLAEVDDLPLAPGMVEDPGGTLFESAQGRIVEAAAEGTMLEVEARSFYDETLPELGWNPVGSDVYRRDEEILQLGYTTSGMRITVHFSITPVLQAASAKDKKDNKDQQDNDGDKDEKDGAQ